MLTRAKNRRGQGLVEYILVVFLMAIACVGVLNRLSNSTRTGFQNATDTLKEEFGG